MSKVEEQSSDKEPSEMNDLIDQETMLSWKFVRLLEEYDLTVLYDISEVEEALQEVRDSVENFETTHVQLQRGLGIKYAELYPNAMDRLKPMTDWIVSARKDLRIRKVQKDQRDERLRLELEERESKLMGGMKAEELLRAKQKLRHMVKHLVTRIDSDLESIKNEGSLFPDDLQRNISNVRGLIKEHSDVFVEVKTVFGDDYSAEFLDTYTVQRKKLYDSLNYLMTVSQKAKQDEARAKEAQDKLKEVEEQQTFVRQNNEKIKIFEGIHSNVKDRIKILSSKCRTDVSDMADSALLDAQKDLVKLDSELTDVLDWVTELVKAVPPNYHGADDVVRQVNESKNDLKFEKSAYQDLVNAEINKRDLTEEKMKNASLLGITLPKFKGYHSKLDYYSFKSEFEKLIVPRVQAKLLPDYLKNNYLEGHALQVVKEIDDLESIWDRLKLSFGNVNILMSHKLKIVEDSDPIWKIKSNEKIILAMTRLKNAMTDMSVLAAKHNVEGILYHPSNLSKIFFLLGNKMQSSIMKKSLEKEHGDQETWYEIVSHLDKELRLKEQIMLFNESHSSDKSTSKKGASGGGSVDSTNCNVTRSSNGTNKCYICGDLDHEPTITTKGNKVINYFSCEKFVRMSPKQRLVELRKKHFCFQCLTPGLKHNHAGNCFDKYVCPHESHKGFKSGLHILICDRRKLIGQIWIF